MNKLQAIALCKSLLTSGIYAMPVFDTVYQDWTIRINHNFSTVQTITELVFVDCMYNSHDMTQDFPRYHA